MGASTKCIYHLSFWEGVNLFCESDNFRQAWNFPKFSKYEKMLVIHDTPRNYKHNSKLLLSSNNHHIFAK